MRTGMKEKKTIHTKCVAVDTIRYYSLCAMCGVRVLGIETVYTKSEFISVSMKCYVHKMVCPVSWAADCYAIIYSGELIKQAISFLISR